MSVGCEEVEFQSAGVLCRGWLLSPDREGPSPCVVMAHGFGLTRHCGLRPFAQAIAKDGYRVLLFDYRHFGDSAGTPRQLVSFRHQLRDWAAAIAFARTHPSVDPHRVATWGTSLGAGHALTAAARDPKVAAVIALNPMFSGLSSTLAAMRGWSLRHAIQLVASGVLDLFGSLVGARPLLVPTTAPAGEFGLLTSPDAYPGYTRVVPADFNFHQAARIALHFWSYRPGRLVRGLGAPLLVLPCLPDAINPPRPTLRFASKSPRARVVTLDCHHMDVYHEPFRSQVIEATQAFLAEHLPC